MAEMADLGWNKPWFHKWQGLKNENCTTKVLIISPNMDEIDLGLRT